MACDGCFEDLPIVGEHRCAGCLAAHQRARETGAQGGRTTLERHGRDHYQRIAAMGNAAPFRRHGPEPRDYPPCVTCQERPGNEARGECPRCYVYRWRHGVARPPGLVNRRGVAASPDVASREGLRGHRIRAGTCPTCGTRPDRSAGREDRIYCSEACKRRAGASALTNRRRQARQTP